MNTRFLSLTSAMALLAATAAFGQSPFPSVSGQQQQSQPQSSPFPSVGGQPQQPQQQKQPSAFPSVGGGAAAPAPAAAAPAAPSAFPSVSGGAAAAPATPAFGMGGSGGLAPGGGFGGGPGGAMGPGFGGPQQQAQEPPCMADFVRLRNETERRGKAVQAASKRKAAPPEACKLIASFVEADKKMISFVEANQRSCGIPPNVPADMKKQHVNYEQLRARVCEAAQAGAQQRQQGPSFSDVLGTATLPEATTTTRGGGSTFDTLNGNVLSR